MYLKRIVLLVFTLFFLIFPTHSSAQMIPMDSITPTPIPMPVQIEYPLPYPGILPGGTLYMVKSLRDKILEFTILNPFKKTEFYLLQADKKLSSALVLFNMEEEDRAESSFSKGLDFLEKSINEESVAKNSPGNLMELSEKIKQSAKKQKEIAKDLFNKSNGELRGKYKNHMDRAEKLEKRAEAFRL